MIRVTVNQVPVYSRRKDSIDSEIAHTLAEGIAEHRNADGKRATTAGALGHIMRGRRSKQRHEGENEVSDKNQSVASSQRANAS